MLASFALAAMVGIGFHAASVREGEAAALLNEVVASHVRAVLSQRRVDVASSDRHAVKPWLSAKLNFSPPMRDWPLPGAEFLGGRVDYVGDRPVAALVYRQRAHAVDLFIWPEEGADAPAAFTARRGFQIAHWRQAGMVFWLVSDLNHRELADLAEVFQR